MSKCGSGSVLTRHVVGDWGPTPSPAAVPIPRAGEGWEEGLAPGVMLTFYAALTAFTFRARGCLRHSQSVTARRALVSKAQVNLWTPLSLLGWGLAQRTTCFPKGGPAGPASPAGAPKPLLQAWRDLSHSTTVTPRPQGHLPDRKVTHSGMRTGRCQPASASAALGVPGLGAPGATGTLECHRETENVS